MSISVKLFQYNGIAYASGDVQISEAENLSPGVNTGEIVLPVPLKRRRLQLNARGITEGKVSSLDSDREASILNILGGSPSGADITIVNGVTIQQAKFMDYQPGAPIKIGGIGLLEQVSFIYDSMVWS